MKFIERCELSDSEKLEIFVLWNNEYPDKLSFQAVSEFDNYLTNLVEQSHILLVDEQQKIKGWYFDFVRENERWFAIILHAEIHGKGYGTQLLRFAKEKEKALNGWVIDHNKDKKSNGEHYVSPLNFYLKNGFEKLAETRLELDKISAVKIKWSRNGHHSL